MNYPYFWQTNSILSYLMIPLSWVFRCLTCLRKYMAKPVRLGQHVICVGNVTAGGTGKTQIIKWLATYLKQQQIDFVMITKGYNSNLKKATIVTDQHTASDVGDESLELSKIGTVIASPKIQDAMLLISKSNAKVILVDDGLQNPNFIKDTSILAIDPLRGIGNGRIIPAGPMREPFESGADKVDIIMSVGNNTPPNSKLTKLIQQSNKPYFEAHIKADENIDHNKKYIAFCGIGNPEKFYNSFDQNSFNIIEKISFPDHHIYKESDLNKLYILAKQNNAELITTRKDYVKLPGHQKINVLDVKLDFAKDEAKMQSLIKEILSNPN